MKTMVASRRSVRMGNEDDGSVRRGIRTGNEDDGSVRTQRQDGQ
jgi:hypothetical protein